MYYKPYLPNVIGLQMPIKVTKILQISLKKFFEFRPRVLTQTFYFKIVENFKRAYTLEWIRHKLRETKIMDVEIH
jgi:hypothetical protein